MRIQEIADTTGLSKKAINLYEKKGLLQVIRDENGYRCYTQEHVRILMRIKILRRMDVSLADIEQLLQEKNMQLLDMQKEQLEKKLAQCELQNLYMQRIAALLEEEHTELLQSADREMEEAWEEVQEPQPDKRNVSSFIVVEVMLATLLLDNGNMLYAVIGAMLLVHVFYVIGKASSCLESPLDYLLYMGIRRVRTLYTKRRVCIMDEPFVAIDAKSSEGLCELISKKCENTVFLITSHTSSGILPVVNRLLALDGHHLVLDTKDHRKIMQYFQPEEDAV